MTDDDPRDEIAKFRADIDQFKAATGEIAALMAAYYIALVNRGVPPEAATQLAMNYQGLLFVTAMQQRQDAESGNG